MTTTCVRPIVPDDNDALARIWYEGWHEAHAHHVPRELVVLRTLPSFSDRIADMGDRMRVAGSAGAPVGLCAIRDGELDQLFVARAARGTGNAAALLANGEARLASSGVRRAFLLCVPQNIRAARFYARHDWVNMGECDEPVFTADGPFPLRVLRFEKTLALPKNSEESALCP